MDKEEKELQIKLATLQADIQIWLTVLIGFFAVIFSFIIYSSQMYNTLPDSNPLKSSYGLATPIGFVLLFVVVIFCSYQMAVKRREMEEL
jgi:polyferredoxin